MTHQFRITVEGLTNAGSLEAPVAFVVDSHDDLLAIMTRVRALQDFGSDQANALALGLKLFSGVMLARRGDPLFAPIEPEVRAFTGNLKARVSASAAAAEPRSHP